MSLVAYLLPFDFVSRREDAFPRSPVMAAYQEKTTMTDGTKSMAGVLFFYCIFFIIRTAEKYVP